MRGGICLTLLVLMKLSTLGSTMSTMMRRRCVRGDNPFYTVPRQFDWAEQGASQHWLTRARKPGGGG